MTIRQPGLAPVVSERSHQAPLWRDRLVRHVISRAISNRLSVNTGQGQSRVLGCRSAAEDAAGVGDPQDPPPVGDHPNNPIALRA